MDEFHRPSGPLAALPGVRPLAEFLLDRNGDEERPGLFVQGLKVNGLNGHVWPRIRPGGFVQPDAAVQPLALPIGAGPGHDKGLVLVLGLFPPVSQVLARDQGDFLLLPVQVTHDVAADLRAVWNHKRETG